MSASQDPAVKEFTYTDPEYWIQRWNKNEIEFHKLDIHPMLNKYLPKLTEDKTSIKIFIPLCGKAVDIAW